MYESDDMLAVTGVSTLAVAGLNVPVWAIAAGLLAVGVALVILARVTAPSDA